MKQTINFELFCDGFPESYQGNFSYEGKKALFNYLEEYEDSTGEEVEFDPITLCCEYTEYDSFKELQENYTNVETIEDLQDHTTFIPMYDKDGKEMDSFIIQDY